MSGVSLGGKGEDPLGGNTQRTNLSWRKLILGLEEEEEGDF